MLLILSVAFFPSLKYVCFHLVAEGVTASYLIHGTGAHKRMTKPIYWNFTVFTKATVSISSFIVKAKINWQTSVIVVVN